MRTIAPISAVIATRDRSKSLCRTLESFLMHAVLPFEFIVVDASGDDATKKVTMKFAQQLAYLATVRWVAAEVVGAAPQRNQGVALATQPFIWFFDDDIIFEPNCAERLWNAIESDRQLGGVNAMIVNQQYHPPGFVSRTMFTLMHGHPKKSFAGKVIGPAINLLPEDRDDLPDVVPVEWLNTGCTIYRREALPAPAFDPFFTGYSLMEDLALSLRVGKKWKLANVRRAHVVHDSQPADYKSDEHSRSCMELVNRHFVMTRIMGRRGFLDYAGLAVWELFSLASAASSQAGRKALLYILRGKWNAVRQIVSESQYKSV